MRAYYSDKISNFLTTSDNEILGQLLMKHKFSNDQEQKNAWAQQIEILKFALKDFPDGTIYFEFAIPRMGKRADNILIFNGIIYVLEFKVYSRQYDNYAIDQATDYALDLKNFHSESHNKVIIPILIATEGESPTGTIKFDKDGVASCIRANKNNLGFIISKINSKYAREPFDAYAWEKDVSELNKRLKEIDDEIELNQDTIIGVEEKRKKLNHEIFRAKHDANFAYKDVINEKLDQLAPLYVKAGTKFVKILKEYITLEGIRDFNSSADTKVGWNFTKIPNVMNEQEPLMNNNHYEICRELTEEVSKKYEIPDYMPERLPLF